MVKESDFDKNKICLVLLLCYLGNCDILSYLFSSFSHSCYGHAGAKCADKIFISGGQRFSGCANNMSVYTPALNLWEEKAAMLHGRCNHVMLEVGSNTLESHSNL